MKASSKNMENWVRMSNIYLITAVEGKQRVWGTKQYLKKLLRIFQNEWKTQPTDSSPRNPGEDRRKEIHITVKLQKPGNNPKMLKSWRKEEIAFKEVIVKLWAKFLTVATEFIRQCNNI